MDLFDKENNKYGARDKKKKLKDAKLGKNSYVPAGLTAAQYEAIRTKDAKKRDERYKKNGKREKSYLWEKLQIALNLDCFVLRLL